MGHTGKERNASEGGRTTPHGLVRIGLGMGGAPFLPSPSPFPSPTQTREGGVLGVGLLPWRALLLDRPPPPLLLYIRGQGAPHRHNN